MKTKRNILIPIRVSEEEAKWVREKADQLGLSLASYLRMLIHLEAKK